MDQQIEDMICCMYSICSNDDMSYIRDLNSLVNTIYNSASVDMMLTA